MTRSGVLLIDRAPLPSEQVLSTHTIHPPGVAILDELGVGDAVRAVGPATRVIRIAKGDAWVDIAYSDSRVELCPRRERLDGLLQDAAVKAGAELREKTRATAIRFENGRAVGLQARCDDKAEEITASLIVGADGRRSFVAAQVGVEE